MSMQPIFFFFAVLVFELRASTCKAGALLLESHPRHNLFLIDYLFNSKLLFSATLTKGNLDITMSIHCLM
jgi:hypothetical protein